MAATPTSRSICRRRMSPSLPGRRSSQSSAPIENALVYIGMKMVPLTTSGAPGDRAAIAWQMTR
jgi:hypothetical protein